MVKFSEHKIYLSHKQEVDYSEFYIEIHDLNSKQFKCRLLQGMLERTDWMITRHQEQILANVTPKLTDDELAMLIKNRTEARKALKHLIPSVTNDTE